MGLGFVLLFWLIIGSFLGLLLGGLTKFLTGNLRIGLAVGCASSIAPPLLMVATILFQNRDQPPEGYWHDAFGTAPPASIAFTDAEVSFTNDSGGRAFWFTTDPTTIVNFASSYNFVFVSSAPDGGVKRSTGYWGWTPVAFSSACEQVDRYEAPTYWKESGSLRLAQLRYCPNTGEGEILLVWVD